MGNRSLNLVLEMEHRVYVLLTAIGSICPYGKLLNDAKVLLLG